MTQIMSLRNLAPVIQERILELPAVSAAADSVNEHTLRGVAQRWDWREQMRMWEQLEGALGKSAEGRRGGEWASESGRLMAAGRKGVPAGASRLGIHRRFSWPS
jgi:hypothetical protein